MGSETTIPSTETPELLSRSEEQRRPLEPINEEQSQFARDEAVENPSFSSSEVRIREWESVVVAWLSTLTRHAVVTESEIEGWMNSGEVSLPEELESLPRAQLYERVISIHKLVLEADQAKEDNLAEPVRAARFQRTDQWIPVYSWLESLDKSEVVKSKEISEWLMANPDIKEKLCSRHSRGHLMHYIQKCHLKILKRHGKLQKPNGVMSAEPFASVEPFQIQGTEPPKATFQEKIVNNEMARQADCFPDNSLSNLSKDKDVSMAKRSDALRRYQLFTELEYHLGSLLSKHKTT